MLIEYAQYLLIFSLFINIYFLLKFYLSKISYSYVIILPKFYFLLINFIFFILIYSYIVSDFSIINVIENSHISLPILYKISGLWSNHEGSIFLWLWVLSLYSFILSLFIKESNKLILSKVIITQTYINIFFIIFILFTSNPILRINFLSLTGTELNPILQDPGLVIHPPFLYLGYLGFSIPFCYTIVLLKEKIIYSKYFWQIKIFVLISWIFLTFGIFLGSWWAYHELGWGGWWFWDPVENISLLPWLISTTLLHSFLIVKKNKSFILSTYILLLLAYILSITGTFFVRSGLLASVHSFATDIFRATFIFIFIIFIIIFSFFRIKYYYLNNIKSINSFFNISKENFIFYNIFIFIVITICIFIGTYSPTFFVYFLERQVSIGQNYYNNIIIPLLPFFIAIMGISPYLNWSKSSISKSKLNNYFLYGFLIAIAILISYYLNFINIIILLLSTWLIISLLYLIILIKKFNAMIISHLAVGFFIIAVIITSFFEESLIQLIKPGDNILFKDYHVILRSLNQIIGPNFNSIYGEFVMLDENFKVLSVLFPEKRLYFINNIFTSKSVIHSNFLHDFYILLGDGNINSGWYSRIMYKPGMMILWTSFLLLVIGGLKSLYELTFSFKNKIIWI